VRVIIAQHERGLRVMAPVEDYEARSVSKKILRIVLSYTKYINRTVWQKIPDS
jgi:UDP-N-acetylglucosamine 2-epimerase (non-hydrolysing)